MLLLIIWAAFPLHYFGAISVRSVQQANIRSPQNRFGKQRECKVLRSRNRNIHRNRQHGQFALVPYRVFIEQRPASGTFAVTGNVATTRSSHVALLLNNAEVLIVGGDRCSGASTIYLATAELYNPTTEVAVGLEP
jgi:hypothetical protein